MTVQPPYKERTKITYHGGWQFIGMMIEQPKMTNHLSQNYLEIGAIRMSDGNHKGDTKSFTVAITGKL